MADMAQVSKLHWAVRNADVGSVRKLLQEDKTLVKVEDYDKRTPLHVAAAANHRLIAQILLEEGASINARDRWGSSPCGNAQSEGHAEMVRLLKEYGGEDVKVGHHEEGATTGPPLSPPLPKRVDWEISPSEINLDDSELIGKGSFGEIRKASWRGTPVAVKTIRPSLSKDRMVVKDFRHEVELLVKIRHPNIVQFLGAVTQQPPLMLITEYLAGGDLHELLRKKYSVLSAPLIVKYSLDIARGMCYLHNGPNVIIHRDLKPRNLILDEAQELKVGDFGLSKLIEAKHLHDVYKMTGETGSYRYMAPEVFKHERYDKSVDVFSFAMILYEMFEVAAPFEEEKAYAAAQLVAEDGKRPPMKAKTYPPGMRELIQRCWSTNPKERPNFDTIVQELQTMEDNCPQNDRVHLRDLLHIRRHRV
jgi:tRNA A-37 threonylcarbamoyl transferase component Bud32